MHAGNQDDLKVFSWDSPSECHQTKQHKIVSLIMSKHVTELESVKQLLLHGEMWKNLVFSSSLVISQPSDQSNNSQILTHMKETCKEFLKISKSINRDYDELNSQYQVQHRQLIKQQCRLGSATAFLDIYSMSYVVLITIKLLTLINKTRQELRGCLWM